MHRVGTTRCTHEIQKKRKKKERNRGRQKEHAMLAVPGSNPGSFFLPHAQKPPTKMALFGND